MVKKPTPPPKRHVQHPAPKPPPQPEHKPAEAPLGEMEEELPVYEKPTIAEVPAPREQPEFKGSSRPGGPAAFVAPMTDERKRYLLHRIGTLSPSPELQVLIDGGLVAFYDEALVLTPAGIKALETL